MIHIHTFITVFISYFSTKDPNGVLLRAFFFEILKMLL